ncbi:hypothetical protein A4X09_0g5698 [Tilletia walkeri]|uniref:Peptidase A2 domain-containing protein n=1 Tax=Tilletia walkeri TaxID=117179 RepID=A0A8X7T3D5_9BASI|nr:hypothetical protein A4X09_0g5698 [Tilletia walkeri]
MRVHQPQAQKVPYFCMYKYKGTTLRTLLDTGASDNFMSATVARKLHLNIDPDIRVPGSVSLPDGRSLAIHGGFGFGVTCGTFSADLTARVIDMTGYDLILGIRFCRAYNWTPDWNTDTHQVTDSNGTDCLLDVPARNGRAIHSSVKRRTAI